MILWPGRNTWFVVGSDQQATVDAYGERGDGNHLGGGDNAAAASIAHFDSVGIGGGQIPLRERGRDRRVGAVVEAIEVGVRRQILAKGADGGVKDTYNYWSEITYKDSGETVRIPPAGALQPNPTAQ